MDTYSFSDIFDIDALQKLIDALSASLQVGISIRGPHGERYLRDSDYCCFCRDVVKKSRLGSARCEESDLMLCAYKEVSPYICHCQSAGLIDAGINIMVDDYHMASMLVGQVRLCDDELSDEEYRHIARSLQLDEEEYLRSIHSIPLKTQEQFQGILTTLSLIAEHLSKLGQNNLYLKSIISSMENQEQLHKMERALLENLAEKDSLTGLYNRRKFEEVMEEYSTRTDLNICIVSGDANFLKMTNDIFGHETGDAILISIAKAMSGLTKSSWLLARCGGDEFRVIIPDAALPTAKDYCKRVARICHADKSFPLPLSVALGAAQWDSESETLSECFSRADANMYENKAALKQAEHLPDYILERLYERQVLSRDVVEYSTKLAYEFSLFLGFSSEQAEQVSLAIHYQDIGMSILPESVMIRGQSRTEEETLQVQSHTNHGYKMARQFEELYKTAGSILCSHENWDGNGYPQGLTGYQIPVESRIIRIVDNYAYWTIPTKRGSNFTREDARKRLIQYSGAMYDPDLVGKFLKFTQKNNY